MPGFTVARKSPVARKPPGPIRCRICEAIDVPGPIAAMQVMQHPGLGHIWPQCRLCQQRIERHVAGLRAARRAVDDAYEDGLLEEPLDAPAPPASR